MYFYDFFQTDALTFSYRLDKLKQLHRKISSRQNGIPIVQKRDPLCQDETFYM